MRLLRLRSSNPKFKTLEFRPGLNIVSGLQLSKEDKKTINGIGKSLSLNLIHHVFGSSFSTSEEKKLGSYLKSYGAFFLEFEHRDVAYTIKKDFSQTEYYINEEKILKTNYPKELTKIFVGSGSTVRFKQLLNVFARRYGGTYYVDCLTQQGRPKEDYFQKFVNLYLLGIEMELVSRKATIKERLAKLEKAEKVVKEYEEKHQQAPKDLLDDINRLKKRKEEFVIAENYDELVKEADTLTLHLNELRDEIHEKEKLLSLKKRSFEKAKNVNVDVKKIEAIYHEAEFFFKEDVTKRLSEAQDFHNALVESRKEALSEEIGILESRLGELRLIKKSVAVERDEKLHNLDKKGAFEEYDALVDEIKKLELEKGKLDKYEALLNQFREDQIDLDLDNAGIKKDGLLYLKSQREKIESIEEIFRSLVKRFYDNKGGSFDIVETSDAKYLFDIVPHVPKEGSQGVGEVKIFCYDVLLYLMNKELLGFMAHDGCIFSEMDPRQKSMIFKVVLDLIQENDFQYFINIGENSLKEVLDEESRIGILSAKEKQIIAESQILKLYDKDPQTWLFGEQFN